jgi:hypothetical protein
MDNSHTETLFFLLFTIISDENSLILLEYENEGKKEPNFLKLDLARRSGFDFVYDKV